MFPYGVEKKLDSKGYSFSSSQIGLVVFFHFAPDFI